MPTPQEALSAALNRWNAGDLDGYLSWYDEGIRLHGYSPEPMTSSRNRSWKRLLASSSSLIRPARNIASENRRNCPVSLAVSPRDFPMTSRLIALHPFLEFCGPEGSQLQQGYVARIGGGSPNRGAI